MPQANRMRDRLIQAEYEKAKPFMADPGAIKYFPISRATHLRPQTLISFSVPFCPAVGRRTSVTPNAPACVQDALTEDARPISLLAQTRRDTTQKTPALSSPDASGKYLGGQLSHTHSSVSV